MPIIPRNRSFAARLFPLLSVRSLKYDSRGAVEWSTQGSNPACTCEVTVSELIRRFAASDSPLPHRMAALAASRQAVWASSGAVTRARGHQEPTAPAHQRRSSPFGAFTLAPREAKAVVRTSSIRCSASVGNASQAAEDLPHAIDEIDSTEAMEHIMTTFRWPSALGGKEVSIAGAAPSLLTSPSIAPPLPASEPLSNEQSLQPKTPHQHLSPPAPYHCLSSSSCCCHC